MNKKSKKPAARAKARYKGAGERACARKTSKARRTEKGVAGEPIAPELLALISNPPGLTRCSQRCLHHSECSHSRSSSGETCPLERQRYMETVALLLRYSLGRGAAVNFLLLRSIADVAAITVQIERAERYAVERGFFYEQRKATEESDVVKLQIQPIVDQINRLYERRRRDIKDIENYLTKTAGKQRSSEEDEGLNIAQKMVEFLQKAKPLLYASLAASDGENALLDGWTYPGDTPQEAERCRREAQRILSMLRNSGGT
jgi:hypothetical protein